MERRSRSSPALVGDGHVYRLGGVQLCALLAETGPAAARVVSAACGALSSDEDIAMIASIDGIATAYSESRRAKEADDLRCTLVHARIPVEDVRAFWAEVQGVARKFAQIPRSGDQVYGFVAGLYPTDAPTLPEKDT